MTFAPLGRLELDLGDAVADVWLEANGERRHLPAGAHLDANTGVFTWAPGVGFLGTYRLVFVRGTALVRIDVTIGG